MWWVSKHLWVKGGYRPDRQPTVLLLHMHISPRKWMELLNKDPLRGAVHRETELSETGYHSRHPLTFTHSHRLHMQCMSTSSPDLGQCQDHLPNATLRIHHQQKGTGINSWNTANEEQLLYFTVISWTPCQLKIMFATKWIKSVETGGNGQTNSIVNNSLRHHYFLSHPNGNEMDIIICKRADF